MSVRYWQRGEWAASALAVMMIGAVGAIVLLIVPELADWLRAVWTLLTW